MGDRIQGQSTHGSHTLPGPAPVRLSGADEDERKRPRSGLNAVLGLLCVAAWSLSGLFRSFSGFTRCDDEGSVLVPVAEFARGGRLYDDVQALYGPFFYACKWLQCHWLGLPVTHDLARLHSWVCWCLAAALLAVSVWRATRSLPLAAAIYGLCYGYLSYLAVEPGHPQELVAVLVGCCLALCASCTHPGRRLARCAGLGVCTGALLATKPNIGAFALVALTLWILDLMAPRRLARPVSVVVAVGACLLPFALMRAHLHEAWTYATIVSLAMLSVACLGRRTEVPPLFGPRHLAAFILSSAACVGGAALFVVVAGTTWRGCLNGLLLQHFSFGSAFHVLPRLEPFEVLLSVLATAVALASGSFPRRPPAAAASAPGDAWPIARLVVGVGAVEMLLASPVRWDGHINYLALPWLWLAIPRDRETRGHPERYPFRAAACYLGVLLALQAYPVHGSQARAAWVFLLPALGLCAYDGWAELSRRWRAYPRLSRAAAPVCLAIVCVAGTCAAWRRAGDYYSLTPLSLSGARWIRVATPDARAFQFLADHLTGRFDTFVTLPGLNSLYLWTQAPPPTTLTTGPWIVTSSADDQQRLVNRLEGMGNVGAVRNRKLARMWAQGRPVPQRPLVQWIEREFVPVARVGDYELLARRTHPGPGPTGAGSPAAPP